MRSCVGTASLALLAVWSTDAVALESKAAISAHSTATVITDTDAVTPGQAMHVALRIRLAPNWHTYWKNPGDAGVAPQLTLSLPGGTTAGQIVWPAPRREAEGPLTTYAYLGDVVLPVEVTPGNAPFELKAHADWLVCRDICVPEQADFALTLPSGPGRPSSEAALFASAVPPPRAPFRSSIAPTGILTLSGAGLPRSIEHIDFIPSADGVVERSTAPVAHHQDGSVSLQLSLDAAVDLHRPLNGLVELTDAKGAATAFAVEAELGPQPPLPSSERLPVALLLMAALGGGFLLNLMPCVFPILAMKAITLARLTGVDRRSIRLGAASYTAGVVVAFVTLGLILVGLRQAGSAAGWGFQLQSPVIVTVVAWVLFLTGLNMSGVFAIGGRFAGAGQSLATRTGHLGSFFTGLLAVVVASPCTAAFMGIAITGALASSIPVAMLIFAAMGIGLALPYTLLAAVPGLAGLLPRPGHWMDVLRQALAFPVYAAVVWLIWVVSLQAGSQGLLIAATGILGIGFAAWALGMGQVASGSGRHVGYGAAALAVLATGALLFQDAAPAAEVTEPFTVARLAELRGAGRPVFVNMTAAWCISCLVNERLALSPKAVRDAFAQAHVAYLKGDWTRQDPAITAFLQEHGSDGVPLYLFYPPGEPPTVLPQLLGESTLLDQVTKLRG